MKKIGIYILDFFFPLHCVVCEKKGKDICDSCLLEQNVSPKKVYFSVKNRTITVSSFFLYSESWVKKLIRKGKYHSSPEIFRTLSFFITEYIAQESPEMLTEIFPIYSVLVPVPLHYFRFQKRGYNQSQKIAEVFSSVSGAKILPLVTRKKNTSPQAKCSRNERKKNLENAFMISDICKNIEKNTPIILIDDVVSTASTFLEIQKILYKEGFKNISGVALARGG